METIIGRAWRGKRVFLLKLNFRNILEKGTVVPAVKNMLKCRTVVPRAIKKDCTIIPEDKEYAKRYSPHRQPTYRLYLS